MVRALAIRLLFNPVCVELTEIANIRASCSLADTDPDRPSNSRRSVQHSHSGIHYSNCVFRTRICALPYHQWHGRRAEH